MWNRQETKALIRWYLCTAVAFCMSVSSASARTACCEHANFIFASSHHPSQARMQPPSPDSLGLLISEVLFNPPSGGVDYVELYNAGSASIDLSDLRMARIGTDSTVKQLYTISNTRSIEPKQYVVLTTDAAWVQSHYHGVETSRLIEMNTMPALADARGTVLIVTTDTSIIDRLDYSENMQSPILRTKEGVSLERRSFNRPTNEAQNWSSAASTSGYGTPTQPNSQSTEFLFADNDIAISPSLFSPDNDGYDDILNITFNLTTPNLYSTVTIHSSDGQKVRTLCKNSLLGTHDIICWDGTNDSGNRCTRGYYIVNITISSTSGKQQHTRRTVALTLR